MASDAFIKCTNDFSKLAASIVQENHTKGIIVYGCRAIGDHSSEIEWVNINEYLIDHGLTLSANEDLSTLSSSEIALDTRSISESGSSVRSILLEHVVSNALVHSDKNMVHDLDVWKANVPINKTIFEAQVTHLDREFTFYLHHASQSKMLTEMTTSINNKIQELPTVNLCRKWRIGQPCLALYSDGNYYRAEVHRVYAKKKLCEVQYIDYGNIEVVRFSALKNVAMFVDIPKLASRFYIKNLCPETEFKLWKKEIITNCIDLLVDKICSVRVEARYWIFPRNNIIPFDISVGDKVGDLRDHLIQQGLAV